MQQYKLLYEKSLREAESVYMVTKGQNYGKLYESKSTIWKGKAHYNMPLAYKVENNSKLDFKLVFYDVLWVPKCN